jgi:hypothetical protein
MFIFYAGAQGRADVSAKTPVEETPTAVIEIFRGLDIRRGFLGLILSANIVLQFLPERGGMARVEVVDRSIHAIDFCRVPNEVAEELLMLAGEGKEVWRIARETISDWERIDLPGSPAFRGKAENYGVRARS